MPYIRRVPSYRTPSAGPPARAYEQRPDRKEDWKFYHSRPWYNLRSAKLARDPLCEPCLKEGRTTLATQVHHVKDRKTHPELAFDQDNLESVCVSCHNTKRRNGKP
jgi:5-methylcytosine-specific restriction protein A